MTRRIEKLRRHYPKLTVFERLQLGLAALERRDLHDLRALDQTCPGADHDPYLTRLLILQYAASLLVVQLLAHAVLLAHSLVEPSHPHLSPDPTPLSDPPLALDPLPRSGSPSPSGPAPPLPDDTPTSPDDPAADHPQGDRATSLFRCQAAIWRAFVAWCQDLGHDPHQVLLMAPLIPDERDPAYLLIQNQIQSFDNLLNATDALRDPAEKDPWRDLFKAAFGPP